MNNKMKDATHSSLTAEFDSLADEYYAQHTANVAITGERPEYFAEYKVADLTRLALELNHPPPSILHFGWGIGNSIPHFREYFSNQDVTYADISKRSIELASARFPGNENYCLIAEERLPLEDGSADIAFLWGLYTNMKPEDVEAYNREIGRILRPGGRCFLTAFAEDGVADLSINPPDYVPYACDGPLTVVRYSKPWLFASFQRHGLRIEDFRYHGSMFPKQSEIYLVKG